VDDIQDMSQGFEEAAPSDSAPEQEVIESQDDNQEASEEEKVTFNEAQQAKVDEIIGKRFKHSRDLERERDELRAQLQETQAKLPKESEPEVPPIPDRYDFDDDTQYQQAVAKRDDAIQKRAEYQARQRLAQEADQAKQLEAQQAEYQAQQERVSGYIETGKSFGIDQSDLIRQGQEVGQHLSDDLQNHIAVDSHGPLITDYLHKNVLELEKVRSMSPMEAAVYIATEVKPKLSSTRKTTTAPKPANIVDGGGAPDKGHPAMQGGTFS
jgi:multidrug efflux pump subunit AcrA (membrane-fusion protein)